MPAAITTDVVVGVQLGEVEKVTTPPVKDEVRVMVASVVGGVGFPSEFRAWTVTAPEQAPAPRVWAAVVNTSADAGGDWMVSVWVASVKPAGEAVMVCMPTPVARNQKLADEAPAGMVIVVTVGAVQVPLAKKLIIAVGGAERATTVSVESTRAAPAGSSRCTVSTWGEQAP